MSNTAARPSTPPPSSVNVNVLQATPEHIKQIEINRLKGASTRCDECKYVSPPPFLIAKAKQREKEQQASSSALVNANNKRPLNGAQSSAASGSQALKRDSRLGTYFEYDLSKMVNTKGGFLMDDGKKEDEELRRKELEREKQRNVHNLDMRAHPLILKLSKRPNPIRVSHVSRSCTQP